MTLWCLVNEVVELTGFLFPYLLFRITGRSDRVLVITLVAFYIGHRILRLNKNWAAYKEESCPSSS